MINQKINSPATNLNLNLLSWYLPVLMICICSIMLCCDSGDQIYVQALKEGTSVSPLKMNKAVSSPDALEDETDELINIGLMEMEQAEMTASLATMPVHGQAQFANLAASQNFVSGTYNANDQTITLKLIATDIVGKLGVPIVIKKPFYSNTWFVFLILAVVTFAVRFWMYRAKMQAGFYEEAILDEPLTQIQTNKASTEKPLTESKKQLEVSMEQQEVAAPAKTEVKTESPVVSQDDLKWLAEFEKKVFESLTDFNFTLETLSHLIFLSPRQVRRRLKQITGQTFSQYVREARFTEALRLLEAREVRSVKQLAYKIGMRDAKYFSQQFKQYFGKSPSEYLS